MTRRDAPQFRPTLSARLSWQKGLTMAAVTHGVAAAVVASTQGVSGVGLTGPAASFMMFAVVTLSSSHVNVVATWAAI